MSEHKHGLEPHIVQWRAYLRRRQAIHNVDLDGLENHLRAQFTSLTDAGLSVDEAFLVAVKRTGDLDELSREFARGYSNELLKQVVVPTGLSKRAGRGRRTEVTVVLALAVLSALAVKAPELLGLSLEDENISFYARNASLFVLPMLTGYLGWKRGLDRVTKVLLGVTFALAAFFVNMFPFSSGGATEFLTVLHLPLALWLVVGIAYAGVDWNSVSGRMDFIRFSGELAIYYVLIALGGGVLTVVTMAMFLSIGQELVWLAAEWILPCGALGAVIIGSWLVEAKQNVIENMAPVLTRVFTPLLVLSLLTFLVTMAWTGNGIDVEREVLIGFDLLLVLVLGLLLYAISARDPQAHPNAFDALQLVLIVSALVVDAVALVAIAARISEFGFSPNKVAALGENLILLINLSWSAWLYARFLWGQGTFTALERWQTAYLPVYAVWVGLVVVIFPPLFGFV